MVENAKEKLTVQIPVVTTRTPKTKPTANPLYNPSNTFDLAIGLNASRDRIFPC